MAHYKLSSYYEYYYYYYTVSQKNAPTFERRKVAKSSNPT